MWLMLFLICFNFHVILLHHVGLAEKKLVDTITRDEFFKFLPHHVLRLANLEEIDISQVVTFDLYTRNNTNNQQIVVGDLNRLLNSSIDLNKQLTLIIHGWESSNKSAHIVQVKDRYLEKKDYNIILVDWAPLASNPTYVMPVSDTKKVASHIIDLLYFLINHGASLDNIHLVGHSLGAHIAGYVGSGIEGGKIKRITGLDPALPGFLGADIDSRLDPSDATFVDVIHTCAGALGYPFNLGTVDFYPNGGQRGQPGCIEPSEVLAACSHGRAVEFFAESIGDNRAFPAYQCDNWINYQLNVCNENQIIPMGEEVPFDATGNYYLKTSDKAPYHSVERSNFNKFLRSINNPVKFIHNPFKITINFKKRS